ncbi:MAG: glycosyltransferase family 2 protein [Caulobacteraceae bacterium]|nr:glycosyltransferase family 2 protein [Caulobacteraceae bacterium]
MISVVVPCYNAARTAAATIESALAQDAPVEVIAIDDGSSDDTAAVLKGFGSRIQAQFGPNRGVSAARNSAAAAASGDWLLFLDSDDLLTPGTLARRLQSSADDVDLVACHWREFQEIDGAIVEGEVRKLRPIPPGPDAEVVVATDAWAPPAALLYRRSVVEAIGGFRPDLPVIQDARYLFDAVHRGARVAVSDHVGARYRVVEGSLSRRNPGQFWSDVLLNGRQIEGLWRERPGLDPMRLAALRAIYDQAARGLLAAGDERFFEAEREARRLGGRTRQVAAAGLLARSLGLANASRVVSWVTRR